MAKRHNIDIARLREAVRYNPDTGLLEMADTAPEWWDAWSAKTWAGRYARKPAFAAKNADGYRYGVFCGAHILAHHAAWAIMHGEWADALDHIDGNRENNAIVNLRVADVLRNNWNRSSRAGASSRFVGVTWFKSQREWRANIETGGRKFFLGSFQTEEDAAKAYDAANWARAGRFAKLNFPEVQHDEAKAGDWDGFVSECRRMREHNASAA